MLKHTLYLLLFTLLISCAQTKNITNVTDITEVTKVIDRHNYYSYYNRDTSLVTTNWLSRHEVLQVVDDEFQDMGFRLERGLIYQHPNGSPIVVDMYDYTVKIGAIYQNGQTKEPSPYIRQRVSLSQEYISAEGGKNMARFTILPTNIMVLHENWYWYQEDKTSKKTALVTKDKIREIIRSDVQAFVAAVSKQSHLDTVRYGQIKPMMSRNPFER